MIEAGYGPVRLVEHLPGVLPSASGSAGAGKPFDHLIEALKDAAARWSEVQSSKPLIENDLGVLLDRIQIEAFVTDRAQFALGMVLEGKFNPNDPVELILPDRSGNTNRQPFPNAREALLRAHAARSSQAMICKVKSWPFLMPWQMAKLYAYLA